MKHLAKLFLPLALLSTATAFGMCTSCSTSSSSTCCSTSSSCCCTPHPVLFPRSQGAGVVREFFQDAYRCAEGCCWYGDFGVSAGYQSSWDGCRLARCLFGNNTLSFKGSMYGATAATSTAAGITVARGTSTRDNNNDIVADYFGLSQDMAGTISFKPKIQNFIVDFDLLLNMNWCGCDGLYLRFHAPLAWSKWSLKTNCGCCTSSCCGTTTSSSSTSIDTTPFPAGYMEKITSLGTTPTWVAAPTTATARSIQSALSGDFTFGDMKKKWSYGRFDLGCCSRSEWKVADVDMILGWNFWKCQDYHIGLYLQAVAPTGTKADECYARTVFHPMVGNRGLWELGGGLTAHAQLWCCDEDRDLTLFFEGNLTHMFKKTQVRSFDFTGKGAMSRYMLLKEFDTSTKAYKGNMFNAIDFATRKANVSVDLKGDAAVRLVYHSCGWNLGIGYNLYGNSKENVCICGTACNTLTGTYGFKGVTAIDCVGYATDTAIAPGQLIHLTPSKIFSTANTALDPYGLYTSASSATITSGGSPDSAVTLQNTANPGFVYVCPLLDPTFVAAGAAVTSLGTLASLSATGAINLDPATGSVGTSLTRNPTFVQVSDLDKCSGAASRQLAHKLFGTIGYSWTECCWTPFLDLGGEVDFAANTDCCTPKMWGVWLKGGIGF